METEQLIQLYRNLKPILTMVEQELVHRGAISCPRCKIKHQSPTTICVLKMEYIKT